MCDGRGYINYAVIGRRVCERCDGGDRITELEKALQDALDMLEELIPNGGFHQDSEAFRKLKKIQEKK